jgi:ubiquinone/menaquinone biosynthesis C-methylase UbiE
LRPVHLGAGSGVDDATSLKLLRPLVPQAGETWADIGAGSGVFTRALARLLGSEGVVYAVDRDREAVRRLGSLRVDGAGGPNCGAGR